MYIPSIQHVNFRSISSVKNADEVSECCFPYTDLPVMKNIDDEHFEKIEIELSKPVRECILK